jgi:hypothetical protein
MTHARPSLLPRLLSAALLGLGLAAGAGCQHNDLIESELRAREEDLREARTELDHALADNEVLRSELHRPRPTVAAKETPERTTSSVRQILLGRQTGGYDEDKDPGDEALQVVVEPRDGDNRVVQVPGALHVAVLQITPEGVKKPLSTWDLSPAQLRPTWRSGLLSTGYHVVLPWKTWPAGDRLRVVVQFTPAGGQVFEADRDVTVRLPPPAHRKPLPEAQPGDAPGPELPGGDTPLPPPRRFPAGEPGTQAPRLRPQPVEPSALGYDPSACPASIGPPVPVQ